MEKHEDPIVNMSGLSDETILNFATDPEVSDNLAAQAEQEIKKRQEEGTFDDTIEDEPEEETEDYEEYENKMKSLGSNAIKHHRMPNEAAFKRKSRELEKEARKPVREKTKTDEFVENAMAKTEGAPSKEKSPRSEEEILRKAELQISHNIGRYAKEGYADALAAGIDASPNDAILNSYSRQLWKLRTTNPEYDSAYRTIRHLGQIESDIIPKYAEKMTPEEIATAKKEAYISAIHQGVFYEQSPSGDLVYRYALPERVTIKPDKPSDQIKKFAERYGEQYKVTTKSTADYLKENGLELGSDEIREQSYTGFRNIIDAIKEDDSPDTSKLDWYYDNLKYGEHLDDLVVSLERYAEGDAKAKKVLMDFLGTKPEYRRWLTEKNEAEDNDVLDTEYKVVNLNEEDIDDIEDISTFGETTQKAIMYISQQWGIYPEQIDKRILKHIDRSGFSRGLIYRQDDDRPEVQPKRSIDEARESEIAKANAPYEPRETAGPEGPRPRSETKMAKREIWTEEEKEILAKAKIIALHYICQRLRETGIDKSAEVLEPQQFSYTNYILLRFGCDNANHVIGESPEPGNAMYIWCGQEDGYKDVFCKQRTKREAKRMPGVRAFSHRGSFEGLHGIHDKALDFFVSKGALTIENKQKINNTAMPAPTPVA